MATHKQFNVDTDGKDVVDAFANNVKGRTFLITGPSTGGIGAETAYLLSLAQPRALILSGRSLSKVQPVIDRIHAENPSVTVHFVELALDDLPSVHRAAAAVLDLDIPLDVIINNAGIMFAPFALTSQGIESQLATNHIGHFLFTNLLIPIIRPGGRIVNVSSSGHYLSPVRFTDPNFGNGTNYDFAEAYGQAKTANILHALSLAERLREKRITAFSVHPGAIMTNLMVYTTMEMVSSVIERLKTVWPKEFTSSGVQGPKTLQQGSSTSLVAALDPALEDHTGGFLHDCQLANKLRAEHATKLEDAEKLWKLSEELVQGTFVV